MPTRRTQGARPGGRSSRIEEAVRLAAEEELTREGFAGFSVERVANAAGVNRTTIYRRWPSKVDLLRSVIEPLLVPYARVPDTGNSTQDLATLLRTVRDAAGLPLGRAFTEATVTSASELKELTEAVRDEALAAFSDVLTRAAGRSEVPQAQVSLRAHLAFFGIVMWEQTHETPATDADCRELAGLILTP